MFTLECLTKTNQDRKLKLDQYFLFIALSLKPDWKLSKVINAPSVAGAVLQNALLLIC